MEPDDPGFEDDELDAVKAGFRDAWTSVTVYRRAGRLFGLDTRPTLTLSDTSPSTKIRLGNAPSVSATSWPRD